MLIIDGDVDKIGHRSVEQLVADDVCRAVRYAAETASTSTMALAELQSGSLAEAHVPKLYLTDRQTAGRGRHGRRWISTPGTLTFSLVVDRPNRDDRSCKLVSLAVALGVARSLEFDFAPLKTRLKWPNDVHIGDGKVAGILLEATPTASSRIVIGVGINVSDSPDLGAEASHPEARPGGGAGQRVCSLAQVVGRQIHRYELLPSVVLNIIRVIAEVDDFADDLLAEFRSRCLLTGREVSFREGPSRCQGWCRGIDDSGELIVETAAGTRRLASGEAELIRWRSNA